jgi:hypothetical protein
VSCDSQRREMSRRLGVMGFLIASAALVACGETPATSTVPMGPPAIATSGAGGAKPPTGGAGGARSTAGSGGGMAAAGPVACGTAMCTAPMIPASVGLPPVAAPCCVDPAMGTCGFTMKSSGMCLAPPPVDPECPPGPMGQKGCCLANGMLCGIDVTLFGIPGCFNHVESLALDLGEMPVPTRCDGMPVSVVNPQPGAGGSGGGGAAGSAGSGAGGRGAAGAGGSAAAGRSGAGGA